MRRAAVCALLVGCAGFHPGRLPGAPADATFEVIDGVRLHVVDTGAPHAGAPAVVLLHGYTASTDTWAQVVPVLRATHRVVAIDLKGAGWSARPAGDYSPTAQARLVAGLLDARGIDRVAVVAHSWGSTVALALARAAPARVTHLALYDAWVYEAQRHGFFAWARAPGLGRVLFGAFYAEHVEARAALSYADSRRVTDTLVAGRRAALERPGALGAAWATARDLELEAYGAVRAGGARPTLLLWGRDDALSPLWVGERLVAELRCARLVSYPRCGHFPMLEAADASTRDLVAFLSGAGACG